MIQIPILYNLNKSGLTGAIKGIKRLTNQTKSFGLTSTLSIGAATAALTAFTKKSLSAAIADQRAQASLAKTLQNLNRAYGTDQVTQYIDSLQRATGTSEDLLRPAFERLVRATGDITEAQKLLNLTLDLSAATGKTVSQTSFTLTRAYNGQLTSLKKLGINLSAAEIKSKDFMAVQSKLEAMFSGSAAVAASTYAGQLNILKVSADEASDAIGIALIESISSLSGENGIQDLATQMETLGKNTANVITGFGIMTKFVKDFSGVALSVAAVAAMAFPASRLAIGGAMGLLNLAKSGKVLFGAGVAALGFGAAKLGQRKNNLKAEARPREGFARNQTALAAFEKAAAKAAAKAARKAAEAAEKARKKAIADAKALLALKKQSAALDKLKAMFDMDAIQLSAALQSKLSKEDEARVKALQALNTEDTSDDLSALKNLEDAKRGATFAEIDRLKLVVDESKKSNAEILADAKSRIAAINALVSGVGSGAAKDFVTGITGIAAGTGISAGATNLPVDVSNMPAIGGGRDLIDEFNMEGARSSAGPSSVTVNVNPTGSGFIGNVDDFERVVQTAIQQLNRAGNSLTSAGS
jgi:hypothetical protein